jgi:hypothetical protein
VHGGGWANHEKPSHTPRQRSEVWEFTPHCYPVSSILQMVKQTQNQRQQGSALGVLGVTEAPLPCRMLLPLLDPFSPIFKTTFSTQPVLPEGGSLGARSEGWAESLACRVHFPLDTCLPSPRHREREPCMGFQQTAMNVVSQVLPHPALETDGAA